jgi:CubicO group peptidase (beta-lactamase class C family)
MATLAEETLTALIAALNDPDPAVLDALVMARHENAERAAPFWASFRRQTRPVRVLHVDDVQPLALTVTLKDRWERRLEYKLSLGAEAPHLMAPNFMAGATRPDDDPPVRADWPDVREALEARLAAGVREGWYSGAMMVAYQGKALFDAAYGFANREALTPNATSTRFRMGSMNKMFTGVAALQLAEAGRLGLDDRVGAHLPDYPNRAFAEQVTVRHMLNHTGGAGDFFGPEFREHRLEMRDPQDYIAVLGRRDPQFEPGSQHRYANYGFIVLGRIIEAASGQSYDSYVQDRIFDVAGMTGSGALPEDVAVPGRAVGYMDTAEGLTRNDETLPYRGTPAGGGYTTVIDLIRFAEALTGGALLGAEAMAPMGAGGVEIAPRIWYGAGFQEQQLNGVRLMGHSGGAPGMNGDLIMHPDSGFAVAALSNFDPPQANTLTAFVSQRLPA